MFFFEIILVGILDDINLIIIFFGKHNINNSDFYDVLVFVIL